MSDTVNGGENRVVPAAGTASAKPAAPKGFGAQLRAAREAKGMSIEDVQRHTRLADRQIRALEEERMEDLPEPVYVRAFLRSICKVLEIDPQPLEEDFNRRYAPTSRPAPHQIPEVAYSHEQVFEGSSSTHYGLKAVGLIVVVAVVAAGVWAVLQQKKATDTAATDIKSNRPQVVVMQDNKAPEEAAPAPEATPSADAAPAADAAAAAPSAAAPAPAAAAAAPAPAPAPEPAPVEQKPAAPVVQVVADKGAVPANARTDAVELKIITAAGQRSWVRISSLKNDQTVFEQEIPAGQTRDIKANLPLRVVMGNSTGVRVLAGGQELNLQNVSQRGRTARFRLQ